MAFPVISSPNEGAESGASKRVRLAKLSYAKCFYLAQQNPSEANIKRGRKKQKLACVYHSLGEGDASAYHSSPANAENSSPERLYAEKRSLAGFSIH
jgi:hypothetical protein